MTSALLFRHFAVCAAPPQGVIRLQKLILGLAMEGRLVPKIANDVSVDQTVASIGGEPRNRVIKSFRELQAIKSKDSRKLPKGWTNATLLDITDRISNGTTATQNKEKIGVPVTRIETISQGTIDFSRVGYIQDPPFELVKKYVLYPGDILFSHINSDAHLGKSALVSVNDVGLLHGMNLLLIRPNPKLVVPKFLHYLFAHYRFSGIFISMAQHAIAQSSINQGKLKSLQVILPPLAEQSSIVAKVERLIALCADLGARQQKENLAQIRFGTAVLAALQNTSKVVDITRFWSLIYQHFNALFNCRENIDKLRETVMQLAMRGKLVSYHPNYARTREPFSRPATQLDQQFPREMLESSPLDLLTSSERPAGWILARISDFELFVGSGITPKGGKANYLPSGIPFIRSQNVLVNKLKLDNVAHISAEQHEAMPRTKVHPGDVLLNITGASIGRSAQVPWNLSEANVNQHVCIIRASNVVDSKFLAYYLNSPFGQAQIFSIQTGATREGLNYKQVRSLVVPIPPLEEQQSIVSKLDKLVVLCDQLERTVKQSHTTSESFADSVAKSVVLETSN